MVYKPNNKYSEMDLSSLPGDNVLPFLADRAIYYWILHLKTFMIVMRLYLRR